jgi:positive regulator of sigma E activity
MKTQYEKEMINKINNGSNSEKNTNMLMAAFMFFIFPIIATFIGVLAGGYIGGFMGVSIEIAQIIGGIVAFVLSVVIIKLFDKFIKVDENAKKIEWDDM